MSVLLSPLRLGILSALVVLQTVAPGRAITLEEAAGSYRIVAPSKVDFTVGHVGGGGLDGSFRDFEGTFQLDAADIDRSVIVFTLRPSSVSTGQERADAFLRSSAVFDVERHPSVTFRSISVTRTGERTAVIEGILTARGTTAPARFNAVLTGGNPGQLSFQVTGDILRSPFGMDVGTPIYSNVVHFDMQLTARRN